MELLGIKDLTFAYPGQEPCLSHVNLSIKEGEMLLLLGSSGSGKTTLLKQCKWELTPCGTRSGEVTYQQQPLEQCSKEVQHFEIGYVFQDPNHQIVTDKVWHELAFGLENKGLSQTEMELKIAEVANYFGITDWFRKETDALSGGQKQILNLASVLTMDPKIILLDEPTSQLDPISAKQFLTLLSRIKRELGIAIILTEHRVDEVMELADQVMWLEQGMPLFYETTKQAVPFLYEHKPLYLPTVTRITARCSKEREFPLTLPAAKEALRSLDLPKMIYQPDKVQRKRKKKDAVLLAKDVYFRYERHQKDQLAGLSFLVEEGECYALLGGNGSGKTTLLRLLQSMVKPYAGKIAVKKKIGYLCQDPVFHFTSDLVEEEVRETKETLLQQFGMKELLQKHPYDLSGGEQERLALLIVLKDEPDILLLDEPTKGLDPDNKAQLLKLLKELKQEGKTIVLVTHDLAFAAEIADTCGLLFDGHIVGESMTREFFTHNTYYTTVARRLMKGQQDQVIREDEVVCQ